MKFLILILLIASCAKERSELKPTPTVLERLQVVQDQRIDEYHTLTSADGWLVSKDCDSALWSFTAAAFAGCPASFNARATESISGKFSRRPNNLCWDKKDLGSKTTWSHDMGLGLFLYAWECKDLSILEDHAAYGFDNKWIMGDGEEGYLLERAFYRPSMRGLLYQLIYALGGEDDAARLWPNIYTPGLKDFQAHLQIMQIYLRSDIAALSGDAVPENPSSKQLFKALDISQTMYNRLEEHVKRDPKDPLFQSIFGLYSGKFEPAVDICLQKSPEYAGEYVRCGEEKLCKLSHMIKSCGILLKGYYVPND